MLYFNSNIQSVVIYLWSRASCSCRSRDIGQCIKRWLSFVWDHSVVLVIPRASDLIPLHSWFSTALWLYNVPSAGSHVVRGTDEAGSWIVQSELAVVPLIMMVHIVWYTWKLCEIVNIQFAEFFSRKIRNHSQDIRTNSDLCLYLIDRLFYFLCHVSEITSR